MYIYIYICMFEFLKISNNIIRIRNPEVAYRRRLRHQRMIRQKVCPIYFVELHILDKRMLILFSTIDTGYNGYDEDDEETSSYYMPGALRYRKSNNLTHKKRKNSMKYHSARSYDHGADLPHGSYTGRSNPLMDKRPASNLNVGSVLMKRNRTASRHRIVSGDTSGDTSSFQDEQSSLNGGSAVQKGTEVESSRNFEKQLPYDMAETSDKPKNKVHLLCIMFRHISGLIFIEYILLILALYDQFYFSFLQGSAYEQSWHLDSMVHGEQVIFLVKDLES